MSDKRRKKPHLLLLSPCSNRGGAEKYLMLIGKEAKGRGFRVSAAFPKRPGTERTREECASLSIPFTRLEINDELTKELAKLAHPLHVLRAIRVLLKTRPDVALISMPHIKTCFGTLLACALLKVPVAVIFQLVPRRWEFPESRLKLYRWGRERKQRYVAVSEENRRLIAESFQMEKDEITLIRNGAAVDVKDDPGARERLMKEFGLSAESKILLTVANLFIQKGHEYLIPAAAKLAQVRPDVHFFWVGEGPLEAELRARIASYGMEDRIHLLGFRPDVPAWLQAADLFVYPTNFDGQPFSLMEAMAHELPIISTAASGIPEILEDKRDALLCRVGDSIDLLEKIIWALDHPAEMTSMGRAAALRLPEFDESGMVEETFAVIKKLLR